MITCSGHLGVFAFGPGMGAILAVAGDVEDRAQFVLQLQGLAHQFFRAGVMVDCGQDREKAFRRQRERSLGMAHGVSGKCQDFTWGFSVDEKKGRSVYRGPSMKAKSTNRIRACP
jgi:hypothetical protein